MISDLKIRFSTGTRIGDGVGGAVRKATSAGDSIREARNHAPDAVAATVAKTTYRMTIRRPAMI
jgi:hypothetical protein